MEMEDRMRIMESTVSTHEAVCAERYTGIINTHKEIKRDMDKLHGLLIKGILTLLGGMAAILVKLLVIH